MTSSTLARHTATVPAQRRAVPADELSLVHGPDATPGLPRPPGDAELYWYLGRQRRGISLLVTVAFVVVVLSMIQFTTVAPVLWVFWVPIAVNMAAEVLSLVSGLGRRQVSRASHRLLLRTWHPERVPSVDVYLPTCGEPLDVLRNTYVHVSRLAWPGELEVWVLDDGARTEVAELAAGFGFRYRVRGDRPSFKKAGNLVSAFGVSGHDLIAIFDADFCPRPDFLAHLVPYFEDPAVGIVQSPQSFDTDADMNWLQRTAGSTQEYFYRWVQSARDSSGVAICVGTNAVYRRSALEAAGGFALIDHSEDVHTGVNLMRAGYRLRYVPVQLAKGLCPDELAGFVNQQYRWCNGSMSLLAGRDFHQIPMTLRQRMCFWSGFLYYISTAVNVFAGPLPMLIMASLYSEQVRSSHFIPFIAASWAWSVLLPSVSKTRWRFEVMRTTMLIGICNALAILDTLRGRSAEWVATGAARNGSHLVRTVRRVGVVWTVTLLAGYVGALTVAVLRHGLHDFWPMVLFVALFSSNAVPLARDLARGDVRAPRRVRR